MMQMRNKLLLVFWLAFDGLFAQAPPDWASIVPAAFAPLDAEVADSIAAHRAECAAIRAQMEEIVAAKGFDRRFIFGPSDTYIKEGMHSVFTNIPLGFQTITDRDSLVMRLESLHVDLYWNDKALFRWLDVQKRLNTHPNRRDLSRWPLLYREIPPPLRPHPASPRDCQRWVAEEVVCQLAATLEATSPDKASGKMRTFNPKFNDRALDTLPQLGADWTLPFPPEGICYSFPMNGQYGFRRDESIPGVGYVVFPRGVGHILSRFLYGNFQWKARWCSAEGRVTYTQAELRSSHQIFFNLPDNYFEAGHLYRLEVLVLPNESVAPSLPADMCWRLFRGQPIGKFPIHLRLPDELKITELYFRAGTYDLRKKMQTLKGDVEWQQGYITFETDEPLDAIEMNGGAYFSAPVTFNILTIYFSKVRDALDANDLYYYLAVPFVEPLDRLPLDQMATAELDNTLDAPFVRKVTLGAPNRYRRPPDNRLKALPLPGGYTSPPMSRAFAPDTLLTASPVPRITRAHFERGRAPEPGIQRCTLIIGEFRQLIQAVAVQQAQIRRRMEERANFFFQLEQRRAQRTGKPLATTLEQLRQQEKENLPTSAKLLLETEFPAVFQPNFTLIYSRFFPGSEQRSADLTLNFNPKK